MGTALRAGQVSRESLDLCLALRCLCRHTGGPVVELLLVPANLIVHRSEVGSGSGAAPQARSASDRRRYRAE